jgi:hypothetical protein
MNPRVVATFRAAQDAELTPLRESSGATDATAGDVVGATDPPGSATSPLSVEHATLSARTAPVNAARIACGLRRA